MNTFSVFQFSTVGFGEYHTDQNINHDRLTSSASGSIQLATSIKRQTAQAKEAVGKISGWLILG